MKQRIIVSILIKCKDKYLFIKQKLNYKHNEPSMRFFRKLGLI